MKKQYKRAAAAVLAVLLIVGLCGVIRQTLDHQQGQTDYTEAGQLAGVAGLAQPDNSTQGQAGQEQAAADYAATLARMDLAALQAVNPEVVGWVSIPGTVLSYPMVQGEDNDYYLTHTWNRNTSSMGAVFLDYRCDPAFTDFNTIIYGHRMRNGTMFASLRYYDSYEYWQQEPDIYIATSNGVARYTIFAAYTAQGMQTLYTPGITAPEQKQEVLQYALTHSAIDTGIVPTADDQIITLVTCTGWGYSARLIVQAVKAA